MQSKRNSQLKNQKKYLLYNKQNKISLHKNTQNSLLKKKNRNCLTFNRSKNNIRKVPTIIHSYLRRLLILMLIQNLKYINLLFHKRFSHSFRNNLLKRQFNKQHRTLIKRGKYLKNLNQRERINPKPIHLKNNSPNQNGVEINGIILNLLLNRRQQEMFSRKQIHLIDLKPNQNGVETNGIILNPLLDGIIVKSKP